MRTSPLLQTLRDYRVVTISCLLFMGYLAYTISLWYMGVNEPNNSQGAFASAVVLACVGVIKYWVESKANNDHHVLDSGDD